MKLNAKHLVDIEGKPLKYGNYDPNIISPDDKPKFEVRSLDDYKDVPNPIKKAEISYILPMANFIAKTVGVDCIQEKTYEKVQEQLKQRSLFVILNLEKIQYKDNVAAWYGLVLTCKKHPVVLVKFKIQLNTGKIGISQCRFWNKDAQKYYIVGDPEQKTFLTREKVTENILNYLRTEGIVYV